MKSSAGGAWLGLNWLSMRRRAIVWRLGQPSDRPAQWQTFPERFTTRLAAFSRSPCFSSRAARSPPIRIPAACGLVSSQARAVRAGRLHASCLRDADRQLRPVAVASMPIINGHPGVPMTQPTIPRARCLVLALAALALGVSVASVRGAADEPPLPPPRPPELAEPEKAPAGAVPQRRRATRRQPVSPN